MLATPTLSDCYERNVHHFQAGLYGKHPDCGHNAQYKECKNCKKIVWIPCQVCKFREQEERRKHMWRLDKNFEITDTNNRLAGRYREKKPIPIPITIKAQRRKEQNQK